MERLPRLFAQTISYVFPDSGTTRSTVERIANAMNGSSWLITPNGRRQQSLQRLPSGGRDDLQFRSVHHDYWGNGGLWNSAIMFPQTETKPDPDEIRRYGRLVEEQGFEYILAPDHILGVKPPTDDWDGSYDYTDQFLEPFVLFSNLAAITDDVRFITGVLVLPQRHTALVVKQAATLDRLASGWFVLGAGVGWNEEVYGNLGVNFGN